ncbi:MULTISPECIES: hypothetical protein [unclassified Nostoc]|uniref:hypothetical protein n=1 Tax=unclassified Nostoc TaxID=2593658 RepID=UPI002AD57E60|nr:hypothetical protein [Nostoc sp. DedQUE03]MDZ7977203.1 hypothetical protein [Nostoc sp. DedQUE03]MDZ8042731.1 hypothetical protein [Nostoc sp. DedQUE02]
MLQIYAVLILSPREQPKNSFIALTEEWTVIDVTDAQTMIFRQTDGNPILVGF